MSKVAVQLLSWNGEKYLRAVFNSLAKQSYSDYELLVLDNGSSDGSVKIIEEVLKSFPHPCRFIKLANNIGFANGHNILFAASNAPYVFCVNQDVVLDKDYLLSLVSFLENNERVGSVAGILRHEDGGIDSSGLAKKWYEKVYDLKSVPAEPTRRVFGVSGALPIYRRAAVIAASPDGNLFDINFSSYKEDVDLAWRLNQFGWTSYIVGAAHAIHERGFGGNKKWDAAQFDRQRLSSRNHLLTLVKNLRGAERWLIPIIIFYEMGKVIYTAIFVPKALNYLPEFFHLLPETLKIRKVLALRLKSIDRHHDGR